MRHTKILATLGPASSRPETIDALIAAGLDGARLNFSHGTHEWHAGAAEMVRAAADRAGRPVAILADLQGPKIRVGTVKGSGMEVPTGSRLTITSRVVEGADGVVSTEYEDLPRDLAMGDRDVLDLRDLLESLGRRIPIVAKIEKPQAIDALEEIVAVADGVMVARGDLGVEVSLEMIPVFQKRIIESANRAGKLVITATQMLESMTENPLPTRAEVTDVANAILNGTDVVMLSAETSVGKFPVDAVREMAAIAGTTEETMYPFAQPVWGHAARERDVFTHVVASMAGHACREIEPRAVVVFTRSGRTARILSFERARPPAVAFTTEEGTARALALHWGIVPRKIGEMGAVADLVAEGERLLVKAGFAVPGDTVIFISGSSIAEGATNSIRLALVSGG
jgi:pyruvate kinase